MDTTISQFIGKLETGTVTDADREAVKALADNYDRYTTKRFVEMFSKVNKVTATIDLPKIGKKEYTMTAAGVESLFTTLDDGTALEPKYKADGTLDINTDTTKDTVILGGNFVKEQPIVNNKGNILSETLTGKNIIVNDATISDYSYENFVPIANGNVTLNNLTVDGSTGNLSNKNWKAPNTPLRFSTTGNVTINDMTMTANNNPSAVPQTNYENSIYNALEIWGNPKSIIIKDSKFVNSFSNNAINIFGIADKGYALIENCVFDNASNILRIGSMNNGFENSYDCVIEFRNCVFKNWDTDVMWGSFGLCQFDDNVYYKFNGDTEASKIEGTIIKLKTADTDANPSNYIKFTHNNTEYVVANTNVMSSRLIKQYDSTKTSFNSMTSTNTYTIAGKNIYGTDEKGTHITIKLVNCYRDENKTVKIAPYTDITKQFGPNVFVKNIVNNDTVIATYPNGTQLLVNGTMTDVSGQQMVDTQNRMMILYGKLDGMASKTIVPDEINGESTLNWYPTFIIE